MQRRDSALNHPLLKLALVALCSLVLTACGGWDGSSVCGADGVLEGSVFVENENVRIEFDDGNVITANLSDTTLLETCPIITGAIAIDGKTSSIAIFDPVEEVGSLPEYRTWEDDNILSEDEFPNLRRIEGGIGMMFETISGLNKLEYLGAQLLPTCNVTGLNALKEINGDLSATPNFDECTWSGLQSLERVNGDAVVYMKRHADGTCNTASPFPNLTYVAGNVGAGNSDCAIHYPALEEIGGRLVGKNPKSIIFPALKRVGGSVSITQASGRIEALELPVLESIGKHLWLDHCGATDLSGLSSLKEVANWVVVLNNPGLSEDKIDTLEAQLESYEYFSRCFNGDNTCPDGIEYPPED